jgi:hypothetical protein
MLHPQRLKDGPLNQRSDFVPLMSSATRAASRIPMLEY